MAHQFQKHYTLEEARALLPQVQVWLANLRRLRDLLQKAGERTAHLIAGGADAGGGSVNAQLKTYADFSAALREFRRRDIQIKDLDRGLLDFPAVIGGREVFLCWEEGEDDIEFWHDLDTGYAGREKLSGGSAGE